MAKSLGDRLKESGCLIMHPETAAMSVEENVGSRAVTFACANYKSCHYQARVNTVKFDSIERVVTQIHHPGTCPAIAANLVNLANMDCQTPQSKKE